MDLWRERHSPPRLWRRRPGGTECAVGCAYQSILGKPSLTTTAGPTLNGVGPLVPLRLNLYLLRSGGILFGMSVAKLVRVQEKGQVTIPAAVRRNFGLKRGDLVAVVETADGIFITPRETIAAEALDQIGEALRQQRPSLDEWITSGRAERSKLIAEHYGIPSENQGD